MYHITFKIIKKEKYYEHKVADKRMKELDLMHIWWRESYLMCRLGVFNLFQVKDLFVDTLYIIYFYFLYTDIKNSDQ